ncbi:luciferase family protein [Haloglomus litoreum]|uniref:luciferase domain-containing protein n=1 Tax=Haloglomus litoreum TaxID=3034026 RepID=UPI0023E895B5|nr:luciferase family protein [Haloglomus sp. DT116]
MAITQQLRHEIADQVTAWEGVATTEQADGRTVFTYAGTEFAHIDSDGSLDLPLSRRLRTALVAADRAEHHPVYTETGWTTFEVRGESDIEPAVTLCRLAYVYRRLDESTHDDRAELAEGVDLDAELEAFGADDGVRDAMLALRE